jgi:hypothetical protein
MVSKQLVLGSLGKAESRVVLEPKGYIRALGF